MRTPASDDRLDSWKEIAAFLKRGVRTVQRWEREEGLPVQRHHHRKLGSVFASKEDVSQWWASRAEQLDGKAGLSKRVSDKRGSARKHKLLVLPFENLSGDAEQDYFSDGLTEEMITHLARLQPQRLGVIARTTAMQYKGGQKSIREIARELEIDYILEGSVRREGQQVRITAQLIQAHDQTHLWARAYDRDLRNVLALQSEAAEEIAREIDVALAPRDRVRWARTPAVNPEAYEDYLKGRYHLNRMTPTAVGQSLQWFERALQKDPEYGLAYASLSHACSLLATAPFDAVPPRDAMPRALAAAQKALRINSTLPEAHAALGVVQHHYEWNWNAAESSFKHALALKPDYSGAHLRYAWLLLTLSRTGDALKEIQAAQRIAQEVDPHLLVVIRATRAAAFYFAREYLKAIAECHDAMELDASYFLLHYLLGRCYARKGCHAKAVSALGGKKHAWGQIPLMDMGLGLAHAVTGRKAEAAAALEQLHQLAKSRYVPATYIGILHAGLNDRAQAFEWLENAYQERADGLTLLNVEPMVDDLRSDARFQDLVHRIGIPQA